MGANNTRPDAPGGSRRKSTGDDISPVKTFFNRMIPKRSVSLGNAQSHDIPTPTTRSESRDQSPSFSDSPRENDVLTSGGVSDKKFSIADRLRTLERETEMERLQSLFERTRAQPNMEPLANELEKMANLLAAEDDDVLTRLIADGSRGGGGGQSSSSSSFAESMRRAASLGGNNNNSKNSNNNNNNNKSSLSGANPSSAATHLRSTTPSPQQPLTPSSFSPSTQHSHSLRTPSPPYPTQIDFSVPDNTSLFTPRSQKDIDATLSALRSALKQPLSVTMSLLRPHMSSESSLGRALSDALSRGGSGGDQSSLDLELQSILARWTIYARKSDVTRSTPVTSPAPIVIDVVAEKTSPPKPDPYRVEVSPGVVVPFFPAPEISLSTSSSNDWTPAPPFNPSPLGPTMQPLMTISETEVITPPLKPRYRALHVRSLSSPNLDLSSTSSLFPPSPTQSDSIFFGSKSSPHSLNEALIEPPPNHSSAAANHRASFDSPSSARESRSGSLLTVDPPSPKLLQRQQPSPALSFRKPPRRQTPSLTKTPSERRRQQGSSNSISLNSSANDDLLHEDDSDFTSLSLKHPLDMISSTTTSTPMSLQHPSSSSKLQLANSNNSQTLQTSSSLDSIPHHPSDRSPSSSSSSSLRNPSSIIPPGDPPPSPSSHPQSHPPPVSTTTPVTSPSLKDQSTSLKTPTSASSSPLNGKSPSSSHSPKPYNPIGLIDEDPMKAALARGELVERLLMVHPRLRLQGIGVDPVCHLFAKNPRSSSAYAPGPIPGGSTKVASTH